MQTTVTEDFAAFDAAVAGFLESDPVGNTVPLTVLAMGRSGFAYDGTPWFAWAEADGAVLGAAMRTPPYSVALTVMEPAVAAELGAAVVRRELPGALGQPPAVEAFAAGAGRRWRLRMSETQYVLDEVIDPPPPAGAPRAYDEKADESLYLDWIVAFEQETGLHGHPAPLDALRHRLAGGGALWLWLVEGRPVAMAGRGQPVCGVPRVGPVWTPPEHRRRGYAAALTAHVCRDALATGATSCTLFADAANETSNGVYRRIGFREHATVLEAEFRAGSSRG